MVSETLRYKPLLDRLVVKADPKGTLFSDEYMREKAQGYIMLYEMLLGKGSIQGGGKLKRHLMQYKVRLEECLVEAKLAEGLQADASNESLLPKSARRHIFPRYARVNLVACPGGAKAVAARLQQEGFTAKIDGVVPSLLVLPPGTDLHNHAMVKDGRLVLQDKSSCFSAEALLGGEACAAATAAAAAEGTGEKKHKEWRGGDVIDACAAPGNKTMHAASLLHQRAALERCAGAGSGTPADRTNLDKRGKVFAFDKDLRRLALMRRRVDESGASAGGAIETRLQDFLEVNPADRRYSKVTAILLDPSCSGSGIVSAPDRLHENQEEEAGAGADEAEGGAGATARVARLAAFQLQGLLKAMSFPQVQRVCYSTCSVHVEENEDVVAKALDQQQPSPPPPATTTIAASSPGRFELSRCLSRWPRRGQVVSGLTEAQAACLVRTDPSEDETNGFFVAVFERVGGADGGSSSSNSNNNNNDDDNKNNNNNNNNNNGNNNNNNKSGTGSSSGSSSNSRVDSHVAAAVEGGGGGEGGGTAQTSDAVEGGVQEASAATKKKRSRHKNKNRKTNKKKRRREAAEAEAEARTAAGQGPAEEEADAIDANGALEQPIPSLDISLGKGFEGTALRVDTAR
eukprot:g18116.t1